MKIVKVERFYRDRYFSVLWAPFGDQIILFDESVEAPHCEIVDRIIPDGTPILLNKALVMVLYKGTPTYLVRLGRQPVHKRIIKFLTAGVL